MIIGILMGLFTWTGVEYGLHRFVFHEKIFGTRFARDHGLHHARVDWFASHTWKFALAVPVFGAMLGVGALVAGAGDHHFANIRFPHLVALFWLLVGLVMVCVRLSTEAPAAAPSEAETSERSLPQGRPPGQ